MARTLEDARREVNTWHLGKTSEQHETGGHGPGTISTGKHDLGGMSYGSFQLATGPGTLQEYLEHSRYGKEFDGLVPKTKEFNAKWKELAATDSGFATDQHDFIKHSHYDKQVARLQQAGLDLSDRGRAVHDALWSTSVQYRGLTKTVFTKGLEERFGKDYNLSMLSDRDIVEAVQDYKLAHNNTLFRSSPGSWPGLIRRAHEEKADLTRLADSEAVLALSGQYRDWRLGPAPAVSQTQDPMGLFRSNLQHIREGNFAAVGTSGLPAVSTQQSARPLQPDALADGVLRPGERGAAISELQRNLNAQAVQEGRQPPLTVDGVYGRDTRRAVENFQLWNGLPTTGIADRETLAAVGTPRRTLATGNREDAADLNQDEEPRNRDIAAPASPTDPGRPAMPPPVQSRSPRDQSHPDHALYEQIRTGVEKLDAQHGREFDAISERMSASLLVMAKEKGFTADDDLKVAFNTPTATLAAGELVHLFRGGNHVSADPAANRAHMATAQALSVPVEESYRRLETIQQSQLEAAQHAQQQEPQRGQNGLSRSGPVMSM